MELKPRVKKSWSASGKMHRITISLDKQICTQIRSFNKQMEEQVGSGWSLAKTINILVLGGVLAQEKLHVNDWNTIRNLSDGFKISISDITFDEYVNNLVAIRRWV